MQKKRKTRFEKDFASFKKQYVELEKEIQEMKQNPYTFDFIQLEYKMIVYRSLQKFLNKSRKQRRKIYKAAKRSNKLQQGADNA